SAVTDRRAMTARDVVVPDAAPSDIAVSVAPSDTAPTDTALLVAAAPDTALSNTPSEDATVDADVSREDSRRGGGWGWFLLVSLACSGWSHPMSGLCSTMWRCRLHFVA